MLEPRVFGLVLAAAVLGTSILIFVMGGRFQEVEKQAYTKEHRPWWFYLGGLAFLGLYVATLAGFVVAPDRSWAAWALVVIIPVGAVLKGSLVIFNKAGQRKVTSIEGDEAWRKVALARLILLPVLLALAYYA